ncbi:DUF427 domain-containing protein [Paraburkholderia sp. RL18-101-BIB-B]|uniref:DUF427 domain-containing protein n=1 Tax=Paraburkholderia sp. RL18-101-BIB-B TaxID=3031634 RepID=UPI0038BC6F33
MQQAERAVKLPDATHPITLAMTGVHVLVKSGGRIVADTRRAVTFTESKYPPVQYIPRDDVDMTLLEPTQHKSYCPYKGEATYFSIKGIGERGINAVWSYVGAYSAVAQIDGCLAFYSDRVDSIEILEDW